MKRGLIVLVFSILLVLVPKIAISGESDKWKSCCSAGCDYSPSCTKITFSFGNYYCCSTGWSTALCSGCGGTLCTCTAWSNVGCGQDGCTSTQMYQTRSCTPDCTQCTCSRCIGPSYSSWVDQECGVSCGTNTCLSTERCQKRSDAYICVPDQYQCVVDASCLEGCHNRICEYLKNENQDVCPEDCQTNVELYTGGQRVYPTTYLKSNQNVMLLVTFNDSRYNSSQGFNLELNVTIDDQIVWSENNGCRVCGKTLKNMGCNTTTYNCGNKGFAGGDWSGYTNGYEINAHMENGYGRIEFNATLPNTIFFGVHTLKVTPILHSLPITLRTAEARISIADGLYSFVITVRDVFNRVAVLFIRPLT